MRGDARPRLDAPGTVWHSRRTVANFAPWKRYMIETLDELAERHGLVDPFLEVGCGAGEVSQHLARRGWRGTALDSSPVARAAAEATLRSTPAVRVADERIEDQPRAYFATVVMFDVLEHVSDDRAVLAALAAAQPPGGHLVLTVPTHQAREWRWDDEVYGHLRRYDPPALAALVARAGYRVLETLDISMPLFWLMRRGFTALKRRPGIVGTAAERTAQSSVTSAWELGVVSRVLSWEPLWRPLFVVQRLGRGRIERGCEVMMLARRAA